MIICAKCGKEICEDEAIPINGEFLCADCVEDMGYVQCQDCGKWFQAVDGFEYEGDPLCSDCYDRNYCTCDDCGEVIRQDDAYRIDGSDMYVCRDCRFGGSYAECMDCGEVFYVDDGRFDEDGKFLCEGCYDWHDWMTCEDCGRFVSADDAVEIDGEYYCESCASEHRSEFGCTIADCCDVDHGEAIHRYGFKPRAVIKYRTNESDSNGTYGTEDEVDGGNELYEKAEPTALAIKGITDRLYMKHDGSLCNGFEMVSHPQSLAYHMYEMPWRHVFSTCLKAGFRSHDAGTCGLHIHAGRQAFGDSREDQDRVVRKIIVIVNRFWDEMTRFSRRTDSQLNSWAGRNYISGYRPDTVIDDAWAARRIPVANTHDDRYVAVNCENEATVEFRIFRGTLKRDTLIASIQLVDNICNYAKSHSWDEIQHSAFLDVAQYKHFNELDAYLQTRGLAPVAPLPQNTRRTPDFGGVDGV